jgi:hypothetical protein
LRRSGRVRPPLTGVPRRSLAVSWRGLPSWWRARLVGVARRSPCRARRPDRGRP